MGTSLTPIAGQPARLEAPLTNGAPAPSLAGRVRVPPAGQRLPAGTPFGICSVCRGPSAPGTTRCWSCREVIRQLGRTPPALLPSFLFQLGSPVHRSLVGYKAAATTASRAIHQDALAGWLAALLAKHLGCWGLGCGPVVLVPVPSSRGGRQSWQGIHPLVSICRVAVEMSRPAVGGRLSVASLLRATDRPPGRLAATARGYAPLDAGETAGRVVVVVDDIFVSGARMLSAAAALSSAGASVAAGLPLGRLVRPEHNAATARYWAEFEARAADLTTCVACGVAGARAAAGTGGGGQPRTVAYAVPCVVERVAA